VVALAASLVWEVGTARPAHAGLPGWKIRAVEVARSVDLSRGNAPFLTVTVELTSSARDALLRIQLRREDFRLLAGRQLLPCRWLRGGTLPEDADRLRFVLGFPPPTETAKSATLLASLPTAAPSEMVEIRLARLKVGQSGGHIVGAGWQVDLTSFEPHEYVAPALPPSGYFISKAGAVDARIFRKAPAGAPAPTRAFRVGFVSRDVGLYDPLLDVDAELLLATGQRVPLLSALFKRDPSRAVPNPLYHPYVIAELDFALAPMAQPIGAVVRLYRRSPRAGKPQTERIAVPLPK
jgi:hypothetical protein